MAKWRDLVGGFILAFGEVELLTLYLWRRYFANEPPPHSFRERTGKLLGPMKRDASVTQVLCDLLIEANRLADERNTIAHNPVQAQVFSHTSTGQYMIELAITSPVSEHYITDQRLSDLQTQTKELVRALWAEAQTQRLFA